MEDGCDACMQEEDEVGWGGGGGKLVMDELGWMDELG